MHMIKHSFPSNSYPENRVNGMFPTPTDLGPNPTQKTPDDADSDGSANKPRAEPSYFIQHPAAFSISPLGSDNSNYG